MLIRVGDSAHLNQLGLACNTGDAGLFSNVRASTKLGLPAVGICKKTDTVAVIAGGGASLAGTLESIRQLQIEGARVYALNNAASYLAQHGIEADAQIIVDSRPFNARFVAERWARTAYLASQCHPDTYAQAQKSGYAVEVYHGYNAGIINHIARTRLQGAAWAVYKRTRWQWLRRVSRVPELIGGGLTVGLTGLCLVYTLGHRDIHLFGYDSSHAEGKSHAYAQAENAGDELVSCVVDNKEFTSSTTMAGQANDFKGVYEMLRACGAEVTVYGEGLIPTLYRAWKREQAERVLTAVYDLGLSPPTYDFISFLVEAERYRIAHKFDRMDVCFQPGPWHGFRHDDLPPDAQTRRAMLWRVCVAAARLLPSVRNVNVWRERMPCPAKDVFPEGYAENQPKSRYAIAYLRGAAKMLSPSEYACRWAVKRTAGMRYATITMRKSSYWPERNSRESEWQKVATWLQSQGIMAVYIEDADEGANPAALDLDLRAALYTGAEINLGVSNGPMVLLPYLGARYLIFAVCNEAVHSASEAFLNAHGYYRGGDGMGGNGRMIWKPDTSENIIAELQEFRSNVVTLKEKTS